MNHPFDQPGPVDHYLKHLANGQFKLQRSKRSGEYLYYPRAFTEGIASDDLEWSEVTGRGTVYATTTVRRPAKHGGDFNTAIVELEEGPRLLTRVLGIAPEAVTIGMAVVARIETPSWAPETNQPLVVFYPEPT
ncbi:hypothetical protein FHS85_004099 [Rhodoligotrophos appendicifer]|uniref:Zn-ribbon domain-containing OB-fold protein n=1 Tax=Rhodoligotrophos appendicifer TaxID=987056 RepID=UPI0011860EB8|nr:OB-fold domain-containing protein [Rhodoligotrophos appendicifer]